VVGFWASRLRGEEFPQENNNAKWKEAVHAYLAIQDYKKKHADWQNRVRTELGISSAQGN
jgi:hypothetical protein